MFSSWLLTNWSQVRILPPEPFSKPADVGSNQCLRAFLCRFDSRTRGQNILSNGAAFLAEKRGLGGKRRSASGAVGVFSDGEG